MSRCDNFFFFLFLFKFFVARMSLSFFESVNFEDGVIDFGEKVNRLLDESLANIQSVVKDCTNDSEWLFDDNCSLLFPPLIPLPTEKAVPPAEEATKNKNKDKNKNKPLMVNKSTQITTYGYIRKGVGIAHEKVTRDVPVSKSKEPKKRGRKPGQTSASLKLRKTMKNAAIEADFGSYHKANSGRPNDEILSVSTATLLSNETLPNYMFQDTSHSRVVCSEKPVHPKLQGSQLVLQTRFGSTQKMGHFHFIERPSKIQGQEKN